MWIRPGERQLCLGVKEQCHFLEPPRHLPLLQNKVGKLIEG